MYLCMQKKICIYISFLATEDKILKVKNEAK